MPLSGRTSSITFLRLIRRVDPHLFLLFFTFTAYTFGIARMNFSPLILPTLNVTAFTLHTEPSSKQNSSPSRGRYAPAIQNETPAKSLT